MPFKDPEKRKAYHRAYQKEHRHLWPEKKDEANARSKDWKARNKDKVRTYRRRQDGLPEPTRPCPEFCEICAGLPGKKAMCLEHCHVTGKFRGWVCNECNRGLGLLGDDLASIEKVLAYLKRANADS